MRLSTSSTLLFHGVPFPLNLMTLVGRAVICAHGSPSGELLGGSSRNHFGTDFSSTCCSSSMVGWPVVLNAIPLCESSRDSRARNRRAFLLSPQDDLSSSPAAAPFPHHPKQLSSFDYSFSLWGIDLWLIKHDPAAASFGDSYVYRFPGVRDTRIVIAELRTVLAMNKMPYHARQ